MNFSSLIFLVPRDRECTETELQSLVNQIPDSVIELLQIPKTTATIYTGLRNLANGGLIKIEKISRDRKISLTDQGKQLLNALRNLLTAETAEQRTAIINQYTRIEKIEEIFALYSVDRFHELLQNQISELKRILNEQED